jgi:hypothetical protein
MLHICADACFDSLDAGIAFLREATQKIDSLAQDSFRIDKTLTLYLRIAVIRGLNQRVSHDFYVAFWAMRLMDRQTNGPG